MRILTRSLAFVLLVITSVLAWAQPETGHAQFKVRLVPADARPGEHALLMVDTQVDAGWHVYAHENNDQVINLRGEPKGTGFSTAGELMESKFSVHFDKILNTEINWFEGPFHFGVPVKIEAGAKEVKGNYVINFQACTRNTCDIPMDVEIPFSFPVGTGAARPEYAEPAKSLAPVDPTFYGVVQSETGDALGKVKWYARVEPANARPGEWVRVVATGILEDGWNYYASKNPEGTFPFDFQIETPEGWTLGELKEPTGVFKEDPTLGQMVQVFQGAVAVSRSVQIPANATPADLNLAVKLTYQACDKSVCDMPKDASFSLPLTVVAGDARDEIAAEQGLPSQPIGYVEKPKEGDAKAAGEGGDKQAAGTTGGTLPTGWVPFLLAAFGAGLLVLGTPCVFPMIPITVSYFSKNKGKDGKPNVAGATAFGLGIMGTFTIIGVAVALVAGPAQIQVFAAHPVFNLALGVVFLIFALNLLGLYEIQLPSAWANKAQQTGSKKGGFIAPVLMGAAFAITSFTCTAPFVGTVLVAATQGEFVRPIIGMLAFSAAFAIPFMLLAAFPAALEKMPKSGVWMVDFKKYLGFIEIAAAIHYISKADFISQWFVFTRPIFVATWATIFTIAGFWLLGVLKLWNDYEAKPGWFRRGFGLANLFFGLYWFGALNGASTGWMEGFLPPASYVANGSTSGKETNKIPWIMTMEEGNAAAKESGKPIFVNFTGYNCVNCRYMEGSVFPHADIRPLFDKVVPVELYTDRDDEENRRNAKLREELTKQATNPVYVMMTADGEVVDILSGSTPGEGPFKEWFDKAYQTASEAKS